MKSTQKRFLIFYSFDSKDEIVVEKKVNLEVADDEAVNTLVIFKNNLIEEEIGQISSMENQKMDHNTGEENSNIISTCKATKMQRKFIFNLKNLGNVFDIPMNKKSYRMNLQYHA